MTGPFVAVMSFLAWLTDRDESGQGLAEYALAAALVTVVAAAGFAFLGHAVEAFYTSLGHMVGG